MRVTPTTIGIVTNGCALLLPLTGDHGNIEVYRNGAQVHFAEKTIAVAWGRSLCASLTGLTKKATVGDCESYLL